MLHNYTFAIKQHLLNINPVSSLNPVLHTSASENGSIALSGEKIRARHSACMGPVHESRVQSLVPLSMCEFPNCSINVPQFIYISCWNEDNKTQRFRTAEPGGACRAISFTISTTLGPEGDDNLPLLSCTVSHCTMYIQIVSALFNLISNTHLGVLWYRVPNNMYCL